MSGIWGLEFRGSGLQLQRLNMPGFGVSTGLVPLVPDVMQFLFWVHKQLVETRKRPYTTYKISTAKPSWPLKCPQLLLAGSGLAVSSM